MQIKHIFMTFVMFVMIFQIKKRKNPFPELFVVSEFNISLRRDSV